MEDIAEIIKFLFKNISYEKLYKYVLEELEEISKERDDINIKINKDRLNKLIDELEKKVEELKSKKKSESIKVFITYFDKLIEQLKELKKITDRPYDKYEIEPILKKIKEITETMLKIIKYEKIGVGSIIFIILSGILTAIIVPTLKSKNKKKKKK